MHDATVTTSPPDVDLVAVRGSLTRAIDRVAELLARVRDPAANVPGMEWTVGEVVAHLALVGEAYTGYARGATEPFVDVSDVAGGSLARTSAARLAAEPERDVSVLATRVTSAGSSLLAATEDVDATTPVTWNGQVVPVSAMLGIALGEYLVHGLDIARALSTKWPISAGDARLVLASVLPLLPLLVDPVATKGVSASYDLRVRGGARVGVAIDDGTLSLIAPDGRVDCHISADPVALLLVSYGRRSQSVPALTGRLLAWGHKPWLGLRLTSYLVTP